MSAPQPIPVSQGAQRSWSVGTGDFNVSEMYFDADVTLPPHCHQRACLSLLVEGVMEKTFRSRHYEIAASTLFTIPTGERHSDWFGERGTRIIAVEIVPDLVARQPVVEAGIELLDGITIRRSGQVNVVARRLSRELRTPDSLSALAVNGLVFELLAAMRRPEAARFGMSQTAPGWLPKVIEHLHVNAGRRIRIDEVACEVDLHPGYLARAFRQQVGVPLATYAREVRLDRVAAELTDTERPILDIALDSGFADQSHLTRTFRKRFGVTPGEYRNLTR